VQEYGCFVRLQGVQCRDGLAHASTYVDGQPPPPGGKLWCKVLSVSADDGSGPQRVALSLRLVNQRTGADLDPSHREAQALAAPRSSGGGSGHGGGEQEQRRVEAVAFFYL
jgi:hypothetical protein